MAEITLPHRYHRHLLVPEIGYRGIRAIMSSSVIVIGAGGLGCPALQYLAAAGVGRIGIVDYDIVSESNLQRQILYTPADLGYLKADRAAARLKELNPLVDIYTYPVKLNSNNALEILRDYDVILDGSDNFPARFLVNDACVILDKPFVFGALYQFKSQVSVFNYQGGPTYRCLVPEYPDSSESLNCDDVGVLGTVAGMTGCIMAGEVIKIIIQEGNVLSGKLMQMDCLTLQVDILTIKNNSELPKIQELLDYEELCNAKFDQWPVRSITPATLRLLMNENFSGQIVDIREPEDFSRFSIPGSINRSASEIETNPDLISGHHPVIFVCKHGIKSENTIRILIRKFGFSNLLNLEGGICGWLH
ncbi:MAG TPA: HesA/MoeB/ThiF family protein [Bacteroidales bacterium]|nr:HesA/MoeB/ThiF family protein [Bacteroidales bacterium]HPT01802.1 HesA/MoeB/ThiF family protein [Bacteroidales bacterium]